MIDEVEEFFSREEAKKYSKKKMLAAGLSKVGEALIYASLGIMAGSTIANAIKISTQDYKSNEQIAEDAKHFDADLQIANYFAGARLLAKTDIARMPHNNDKPIYVGVSNGFDTNEKEMIKNVLNYYEDLFSNINNHYRFSIVDLPEAYFQSAIGNNVLTFYEASMSKNEQGLNLYYPNVLNKNFNKDSIILIDKNIPVDRWKYYTILHETAHAFGLGDIYKKQVKHYDTFMYGTSFACYTQMLYPNDVAILYAMYGEDYRNGNEIDEEKLLKAKQSFEYYKKSFYDKTIETMTYSVGQIEQEMLIDNAFCFEMTAQDVNTGKLKNFYYNIKVNDENNATFSIQDSQNEVLWETVTKYDFYNGAIFFPSIYFSQGQYPGGEYSQKSEQTKEFMVIAKSKNKHFIYAPDSNYIATLTLKNDNEEMQNEQKTISFLDKITKQENSIEL